MFRTLKQPLHRWEWKQEEAEFATAQTRLPVNTQPTGAHTIRIVLILIYTHHEILAGTTALVHCAIYMHHEFLTGTMALVHCAKILLV